MKFRPYLFLAAVGLAIAHFGLPAAIHAGAVWDSQANPVPVDVSLAGKQYSGLVSQDWDGTLTVRKGDVTVVRFRAADPAEVTYRSYEGEGGVSAHWRRFLPFLLVALLALSCALPTIRMVVQKLVFGRDRKSPDDISTGK